MSSNDEYTVPLEDRRVFGAGVANRRIKFVPAHELPTHAESVPRPNDAAERYLAIVRGAAPGNTTATANYGEAGSYTDEQKPREEQVPDIMRCDICNIPLMKNTLQRNDCISRLGTTVHESSLAHQFCLGHSYPPSHLDRSRAGLQYLASYGWDPDSRLGLGSQGRGIRAPIKAVEKRDTCGLGLKPASHGGGTGDLPRSERQRRINKLDAGRVRKQAVQNKAKEQRLREIFYDREEVSRYLHGDDV